MLPAKATRFATAERQLATSQIAVAVLPNTARIEAETKSPPTLHEEEVRPKASAERKKRKGIQQQKKKESAQPWASEAPWLMRGKRMRIESGRREAGRLSEL